ncbi:type 4b pilus protein PilO2, partial [Achromobacter kerstersii]|uniref:type 4b pilus protein PilO2 n=1 Tax=Achromobacter kerstersii TaxID=1353890 RepID=UPI0015829E9A
SETRAKSRATLFSGAAAFAQMHRHGTHIVACTLPDQSVWLAAVVDGVVQTGGDTIFPDQEKAKNAVEELTARYREHQVHSNYITQARLFSLQQLTAHVNGQSALRRASFRLSMVSPIWWVLIAAVVAYEAWDYGSAWWDERQAKLHEEAQAAQPHFDAKALWGSAISAWAKSVKTQGGAGMTELLNVILTVPVEPGRWRLTEVDCRPSAGSCTATYRRTRLADNHTLRAALAESFRIVHPDLDTATATWPLPKARSAPTVALRDLPTAAAIQTTWEPSWQALRPALQDFTLAKPASVQILVPNIKLPNGLEEPVP